jgi:hypothetical protein
MMDVLVFLNKYLILLTPCGNRIENLLADLGSKAPGVPSA